MIPNDAPEFINAHTKRVEADIDQMAFYIANPEELNPRIVQEWRENLIQYDHAFLQLKAWIVNSSS